MTSEKQFYVDTLSDLMTTLYEKAAPGDRISFKFTTEMPVNFSYFMGDPYHPVELHGGRAARFENGFTIMDSHGLKVSSLYCGNTINLNDSYPDKGLKGIYLSEIAERGGARGIFLGGYNVDGVYIDRCDIGHQIGGTHAIYIAGGGWASQPDYHFKDIHITRSRVGYTPSGRCAIQFNGRGENCSVRGCTLLHYQLSACTVIGFQNFLFSNNLCYGGNRGTGFLSYDYASHWGPYFNYFRTEEDILRFLSCKRPNQNHIVKNNTIVVGPHRFSKGWGHYDDPADGHPGILVNNAVNSGFLMWVPNDDGTGGKNVNHPGFDFPSKNLVYMDNVIVTPSSSVIDIYNEHEAKETHLIGNMIHTAKEPKWSPMIKHLKANSGNFFEDPCFIEGPPMYEEVDLDKDPEYVWGNHVSEFNAFSWKARRLGKGKRFKFADARPADPLPCPPTEGPIDDAPCSAEYQAEMVDPGDSRPPAIGL